MSDVSTHDLQGRPYIKLDEIKAGTRLQFDDDFGCLALDQTYVAALDDNEDAYVNCRDGRHYLMAQAEDNGGYCIGVYAARESK